MEDMLMVEQLPVCFNPLCVQLDMVKGFKDEFYFAKAIVSIRYACN